MAQSSVLSFSIFQNTAPYNLSLTTFWGTSYAHARTSLEPSTVCRMIGEANRFALV